MAQVKSTLVVRAYGDGSHRIVGEAPTEHVFSGRWLDRHLGNLAKVTITLDTADGPVVYELTGFERLPIDTPERPAPDLSGWIAKRVDA